MVPPRSACASAGTQGCRDAHEERGSTTQPGSVPARATCRGEHSAVLRSPFLPPQHCYRGACWQPRGRAPRALSLSIHKQQRQTPPARHLSTTLLCFKAGKPQQRSCPTPPCSKPQASATGISGRKPQQTYLFCQLKLAAAVLPVHYPVINCSNLVCPAQLPVLLAVFGTQLVSDLQQERNSGNMHSLAFPQPHVSCLLQPHSPPCLYLLSFLAPSEPSSSASTVPEAPRFLVEMKPGPRSPPAELVRLCPLP